MHTNKYGSSTHTEMFGVFVDFPQSTTSYIHRVGRTGRAGRPGQAITFFTDDDKTLIRSVVDIIRRSGGAVPDWMKPLHKPRFAIIYARSYIRFRGHTYAHSCTQSCTHIHLRSYARVASYILTDMAHTHSCSYSFCEQSKSY